MLFSELASLTVADRAAVRGDRRLRRYATNVLGHFFSFLLRAKNQPRQPHSRLSMEVIRGRGST